MFEVKDLHYSTNNIDILQGINFTVNDGEIVSLIGGSGAGKTTILRNICGFITPTRGNIIVNGKTCRKTTCGDIGLIPQGHALFENMTALENISYALIKAKKMTKSAAVDVAKSMLKKFGILDRGHAYPHELSGGQKQRVAIARSLVMQPNILLFDEPTAGLDPEVTKNVVDTILEIGASGISILVVTHDLLMAKKVSSRILFLSKGKIIEDAATKDFFDNTQTQEAKNFLSNMLIN